MGKEDYALFFFVVFFAFFFFAGIVVWRFIFKCALAKNFSNLSDDRSENFLRIRPNTIIPLKNFLVNDFWNKIVDNF